MQFKHRKNYRIVVFLLFGVVFTLPFQNCIEQGSSGGSSSSSSSTTSTVPTAGGGGSGNTPATPTMTAEQKQALCQGLVVTPTLQAVGTTELTTKVGMGTTLSGDVNSTQITINAVAGITDKTTFDENACQSLFNLNLRCEVVTNDNSRPIAFSQALDINGLNVANSADSATLGTIAGNVIKMNNCASAFNYATVQANGASSTKSQMVSNADNMGSGYRCASGSFYVRYSVRNSVGPINKTSSFQYLKVNIQNGCWDESKLSSGAGVANALYGSAVSIDGNWAAVVAQTDPVGGQTKVGSVSIFEKSGATWSFRQKIVLPGAVTGNAVQSVALKGGTLFIGTPYRNGDIGAVFQYEKNGQDFVYVSEVPRPLSGDSALDSQKQYFGFALAFDGTKLVVGAPHYSSVLDNAHLREGRIYVYNVGGGVSTHQLSLQHPDATKANKGFGMSLAFSGNYLAVGAPQVEVKAQEGRGDVIVLNSFGSPKKITSISINMGAQFGYSVAMNGSKLIVGAPGYDKGNPVDGVKSGGVFYFPDFNTAVAATPQYSGNKSEQMGISVALNNLGLFFSVPFANNRAGYVNYYQYTNLTAISYRLYGLDTVVNNAFGWGLGVSGNNVIVGANIKNNPEASSGAAYAFLMK